jgi:hypothetical protein
VHRIDFSITKEKVGVAGATLIATPVLVLLMLIGFTWVVLTNQIKVETDGTKLVPSGSPVAGPNGHFSAIGAAGNGANVTSVLQAMNCAKKNRNLKPVDRDAIERLKAYALLENWPDNLDQKEKETFRRWALEKDNSDAVVPSGDLLQLFNAEDLKCEG